MQPEAKQATWPVGHPFVVLGVGAGAASLLGNLVWNCGSCGWDFDRVPWYQAVLVVAVPFILAPVGVFVLAVRAVWLRRRSALLECLLASAGLALPWCYYLVAYFLQGR